MKKKLLIIVVILSMLMAYTGTAFAAGSGVELVSAHAGMSGTVFIFKVSGEFSGAGLKGLVRVGDGREFTLDCRQLNAETVRCLTSFKVQGNVTVRFGGGTFWTYIHPFTKVFTVTYTTPPVEPPIDPPPPVDPPIDPPPPVDPPVDPPPPTEFCYNIYDWPAPPGPYTEWTVAGSHCQTTVAVPDQTISYFNPAWSASYTYKFMLDSSAGCASFPVINDDAFYYIC